MSRDIHRTYLPTPELIRDGVRVPTVPVNLAVGDWDGLNRFLESMRKAIIAPQGTITGRAFRTAVEPDQRVQIDTKNGIRIYNADNELTAQLNGDELLLPTGTITGAIIIGSTFKTATSGERIEIDPVNGIRTYDAGGTLISQLKGTITFAAGAVSGTSLTNNTVTSSKVDLAARGWTQNCVFSVTDSDTVAWTSGVLTASDGTTYNINAGSTGNMVTKTYVYLNIASSIVNYLSTTSSATGVGDGRITIAVCQPNTTEATFQVFGGAGGLNIDASSIVTGSVTANEIAASTITAAKMNIITLSSLTADIGSVTTGSLDSVSITGGTITGTIFKTAGTGNNRVTMDSTDGLQLIDSSDVVRLQLNAAVYAGALLNGIRSIDGNDVFMESNDQSAALYVSSASQRVSFALSAATRAYVDDQDGSGGGNQPTSLVLRVNGALQRVNRASAGGFLYI